MSGLTRKLLDTRPSSRLLSITALNLFREKNGSARTVAELSLQRLALGNRRSSVGVLCAARAIYISDLNGSRLRLTPEAAVAAARLDIRPYAYARHAFVSPDREIGANEDKYRRAIHRRPRRFTSRACRARHRANLPFTREIPRNVATRDKRLRRSPTREARGRSILLFFQRLPARYREKESEEGRGER